MTIEQIKIGLMSCMFFAPTAFGEALSTSSVGISIQNVESAEAKANQFATGSNSSNSDDESTVDPAKEQEASELLNGPFQSVTVCQRISAPTFLGLEIGAGGCMSLDETSIHALARVISTHIQLIYYPLASRTKLDNDLGLRMKREFFGDIYILGLAGLAKLTHGENALAPRSLPSDILEFGGGIGWSYRLGKNFGMGVEGVYKFGSIMSAATTGSSATIMALGSLTAFL